MTKDRHGGIRFTQDDLFDIAVAAGSLLPGAASISILRMSLLRKRKPFSKAVAEVAESLEKASTLVSELQVELNNQTKRLETVTQDYERYQELAAAKKEEAQAFLQELDRQMHRQSRAERLWALAINLIAGIILFIFGVLLSGTIKSWFGTE